MTDQEINRLIAEACPTVAGVWSDGELRWNYKLRPVPTCFDPVNDLNAMHEAWKTLSHEQKMRFKTELSVIVCRFDNPVEETYYEGATARQRAQAFLRTFGKWPVTEHAALDKSPPA